MLDSGSNREAGRRVHRVLEERGWQLKAIFNTHSHADHIGGNRYLQERTGCAVYAAGAEADFTAHPVLEPSLLFGGYPCSELRHKFLLADASRVEPLCEAILPAGLTYFPLPGHFFDMVGFRTAEGAVYLADALNSAETLEKYGIPFLYDIGAQLRTLSLMEEMEAHVFIPSHVPACKDIVPCVRQNRARILEIADKILTHCISEGADFDTLFSRLCGEYRLTLNFEQYALVGSTVRSYLSWLYDTGRVRVNFEGNRMRWHTCG